MVQLTTISRKRVYYIIMLLLISLLVLVFGSLLFPIFITIFIDFIIFALLYLLSFPTLNLAPIVLLAFLMNTNLVIILTTVIIWFLIHMFFKRIAAIVKFLFSRVTLRIIILSEKVTYMLRWTIPNILNLIFFIAISY